MIIVETVETREMVDGVMSMPISTGTRPTGDGVFLFLFWALDGADNQREPISGANQASRSG